MCVWVSECVYGIYLDKSVYISKRSLQLINETYGILFFRWCFLYTTLLLCSSWRRCARQVIALIILVDQLTPLNLSRCQKLVEIWQNARPAVIIWLVGHHACPSVAAWAKHYWGWRLWRLFGTKASGHHSYELISSTPNQTQNLKLQLKTVWKNMCEQYSTIKQVLKEHNIKNISEKKIIFK